MNPDLVAQITKLVLEKLDGAKPSGGSLTDSEIRRWNDISRSMGSPRSYHSGGTNNNLSPLTPEEIRKWNAISVYNLPAEGHKSFETTGQVKFHSHY